MARRYKAIASRTKTDDERIYLHDAWLGHYLDIVRNGLGRTSQPKRVVIVGAGMAGLVAGSELLRAGHEVTILEAQRRVGGRVLTMRHPFTEGLYAEAGAMRIPRTHRLTLAYIERYGLKTMPFTAGAGATHYFLRGRRMAGGTAGELGAQLGLDLTRDEQQRTAEELWDALVGPRVTAMRKEPESGWATRFTEMGRISTRQYLRDAGWSGGAIELFGILENQEALLDSSFLELFLEESHLAYANPVQIEGGMDRLPAAFLPELLGRIRFGARVFSLAQSGEGVRVFYRTETGDEEVAADYGVVAVPFPVLRKIEVPQQFSTGKQRAIRELHYDASTKVLIQCRRRFWEDDEGIRGGRMVTDLPMRSMYYPDHGRETGRGVLLASYTWGEDAQKWGALEPRERVRQAAEQVVLIHPQLRQELEVGASKAWQLDPYAGGAFADLLPGQYDELYPHIATAEGRFHVAGEHASLNHAWIQGAINSGIRAAIEIHSRVA